MTSGRLSLFIYYIVYSPRYLLRASSRDCYNSFSTLRAAPRGLGFFRMPAHADIESRHCYIIRLSAALMISGCL